MRCDGAALPLGCSRFGNGAARHAPRIAPPLLVQPERTPSVSVRPLAAERRGSEAWRIRQRQGGRVSPIHDDDSTRRPIIIAVVVARWRGGTPRPARGSTRAARAPDPPGHPRRARRQAARGSSVRDDSRRVFARRLSSLTLLPRAAWRRAKTRRRERSAPRLRLSRLLVVRRQGLDPRKRPLSL